MIWDAGTENVIYGEREFDIYETLCGSVISQNLDAFSSEIEMLSLRY